MRKIRKIPLQTKVNHLVFGAMLLVVAGLLAFLSVRYNYVSDWTHNNRNSLSPASVELMLALKEPPVFTVYAPETGPARQLITDVVSQYQMVLPGIEVKYIYPELEPDLMRELNLNSNNALQVSLSGKSEFIRQLSEQEITNAIQRLARSSDRWLVFLTGHGERNPEGVANHDYGEWGNQLTKKGIRFRRMKLTETPVFPDNVAAVVIASPQVNYLPGEIETIKNYLAAGGNLLWFTEPEANSNLLTLADYLGLEFITGTVHDQFTLAQRINDPRFIIVSSYPKLSTNDTFQKASLFPYAQAIKIANSEPWQAMPVLSSSSQSWIGLTGAPLKVPANKQSFDIGVALVRDVALPAEAAKPAGAAVTNKQRILVIGDGDFLSNQYQGNAGNLDLGLRFLNWVLHDDRFISIPARTTRDIKLEFSENSKIIIGLGFLLLIPLILAGSGLRIWLVRSKS